MAKKGETSERTKALRARVEIMLSLLGVEWKKEDLSCDFDLLDLYPTKHVLNNMLTRELHRLQALGKIKHDKKKGYYRTVDEG